MHRPILHAMLTLLNSYLCMSVGLNRGEWIKKLQLSEWPAECKGRNQSPINIANNSVKLNDDLTDFEFDVFHEDFDDAIIENDGHTIRITPGFLDEERLFEEGGLDGEYKFKEFHFHWGSSGNLGSEHHIDGKASEMEMHLVHVNLKYKTMEKALQHDDGLAVLAVLFNQTENDNEALEPIIEKLQAVKIEGSHAKISGFNLRKLLPDVTMPYYRYRGSLTTPPCTEVVVWTVFQEIQPISQRQLKAFRDMTKNGTAGQTEQLANNYRPLQPLNEREIEVSGNSAAAQEPSLLAGLACVALFGTFFALPMSHIFS